MKVATHIGMLLYSDANDSRPADGSAQVSHHTPSSTGVSGVNRTSNTTRLKLNRSVRSAAQIA